jgi:hypothetical protein
VITAGIDIGSSTSKAAILEDNQILSYSIIPTGAESADSAQRAMDEALRETNHLSLEDMGWVIATGYGRVKRPVARGAADSGGAGSSHLRSRETKSITIEQQKAIKCNKATKQVKVN